MGGQRRGTAGHDKNFTFVSPMVKYLLFFFNFLFWIISLVMVAIGVYARLLKHAGELFTLTAVVSKPFLIWLSLLVFPPEAALAGLAVDPAVMLMVVGILMFIITFCGCIGSLRENICLLQTFVICLTVIFLLQLAAGVLGFVFSDKARSKVTEMINKSITHYRDDIDLQNLIDFGQREFGCCGAVTYTDWSQNMYFNCTTHNPSQERCSVPFSCCIITKEKDVINTMCGQGMQQLDYLEAGEHIHTNGCIDKMVNWTHSNLFILGGIAMGLAIPQLVGMLLSQILINQIKDQIELQNYNLKHHSDPWG